MKKTMAILTAITLCVTNCNEEEMQPLNPNNPPQNNQPDPPQNMQPTGSFQTVSGTRLKVAYQTQIGSDGMRSQYQSGYWDSELNTYCNLTFLLNDGTSRCLPENMLNIYGYFDQNCTQPFSALTQGEYNCKPSPPRFASLGVANTCPQQIEVYQLSAPQLTSVSGFFSKSGTSCNRINFPKPSDLYVFTATTLPTSAFVEVSNARGTKD